MKVHRRHNSILWLAAVAALLLFTARAPAGPLPGAIFTTVEDGSRVNANIYEAKEDVYLDGGPGPNAPARAASLPPGDYYFQVTDPSGKKLLSEDPVKCRRFTVNGHGVISGVVPTTVTRKVKGVSTEASCTHETGIDQDHSELGAITVQLMPYKDTPNRGGVYKAWVTPVERFVGDPERVDNPDFFHGFVPSWSKTDNFKVKGRREPPILTIRKFHDRNMNCTQDEGEEDVRDWPVDVTNPLGASNLHFTPATILAEPSGTYTVVEALVEGTQQTSSQLDGVLVSCYPAADPTVTVDVVGTSKETHEVVYGNVGLGEVTACKFYDRNGNGREDAGEPPVAGWRFRLTGTAVTGAAVDRVQATDETGCTTFAGLLPGTYVVEELIPGSEWRPTGPTTTSVTIESSLAGGVMAGTTVVVKFGNICMEPVDFNTKGYWHNKNGLNELNSDPERFAAVLAFVNGLDPYDDPTGYYDKGDEPFDGRFANGDPVPAAKGVLENEDIADAGTVEAEISNFLIGSVGDGGVREQLAEQLLAFIFNSYYRLGEPGAAIQLPGGDFVSAAELIAQAVALWSGGSAPEREAIKSLLDGFNNNDRVLTIRFFPCDVVYP